MLRLPPFRYLAPRTVEQAAHMLNKNAPNAREGRLIGSSPDLSGTSRPAPVQNNGVAAPEDALPVTDKGGLS